MATTSLMEHGITVGDVRRRNLPLSRLCEESIRHDCDVRIAETGCSPKENCEVVILSSEYAGKMKKAVFTILNSPASAFALHLGGECEQFLVEMLSGCSPVVGIGESPDPAMYFVSLELQAGDMAVPGPLLMPVEDGIHFRIDLALTRLWFESIHDPFISICCSYIREPFKLKRMIWANRLHKAPIFPFWPAWRLAPGFQCFLL